MINDASQMWWYLDTQLGGLSSICFWGNTTPFHPHGSVQESRYPWLSSSVRGTCVEKTPHYWDGLIGTIYLSVNCSANSGSTLCPSISYGNWIKMVHLQMICPWKMLFSHSKLLNIPEYKHAPCPYHLPKRRTSSESGEAKQFTPPVNLEFPVTGEIDDFLRFLSRYYGLYLKNWSNNMGLIIRIHQTNKQ